MAKQKLTDLQRANSVNSYDLMYLVQSNTSKSVNVGSVFSSFSTANVRENSANLYYTNARARSAISVVGSASYNPLTGVISVNNVPLPYVSNVNGVSGTVIITTSNIAEVSNLYFTNTRVYSNVIGLLNLKANVSDLSTSNVVEGQNLYFTNIRVYSNVIGLFDSKANVSDLSTSNVVEGQNLYFTNTRVYANVISLFDSKANVSDLSTSNVVEGQNLYFTNVRAILAAIPATTELIVSTPVFNYNIDQYAGDNPTIYVYSGDTISFRLTQGSSHPINIRESNGGMNYNTGLTHIDVNGTISTGSGAQGKVSGKLFWKIPYELAGNTYVYQCTNHSSMVGNIVIKSKSLLRTVNLPQADITSYMAGLGDIVYNTTNNKFQGYTTSGWVDLH